MKRYIFPICLFTGLLLWSCNQAEIPTSAVATAPVESAQESLEKDQEKIKELVIRMYKWQDTAKSENDIVPLTDDKGKTYIGINLEKNKLRLAELRKTNLFSEEFINNYDSIVNTIDKKLKNKKLEWLVGDMPPFGDEVNPWSGCQDYPSDNPWDKMKFNFADINGTKATLAWTWDDPEWSKDFSINVRVEKIDSTWKISYLEGFDFDEFVGKY